MSNEDTLNLALRYLIGLPANLDFFESYTSAKEIKTSDDIDTLFKCFQEHLSEKGTLNNEVELSLKIIKEQSDIVKHNKSTSPIYSINKARSINDSWLDGFHEEYNLCFSGDIFAEEIKPRKYKTIQENRFVYAISPDKLSAIYNRYSRFNHPYVNYQVSSAIYNSKNFSQGLAILKEGILSVCSYPNHYWHNEFGIEAAAWMMGDFLYFLGHDVFLKKDIQIEKIKLLKLLFLYLSRYIYMTKSNLKSTDFYSNRARVVQGNIEFFGIFWLGVNPDIQYISDMYLAYETATKNGMPVIQPIQQFYYDSMKMYLHGSHIPNNSGGYQEIEDRTWLELVRVGELRSILLSNKLLAEFENYELNIATSTINILFDYLLETHIDDKENYFNKLNLRKLKGA